MHNCSVNHLHVIERKLTLREVMQLSLNNTAASQSVQDQLHSARLSCCRQADSEGTAVHLGGTDEQTVRNVRRDPQLTNGAVGLAGGKSRCAGPELPPASDTSALTTASPRQPMVSFSKHNLEEAGQLLQQSSSQFFQLSKLSS